jgi:hypothetical protein
MLITMRMVALALVVAVGPIGPTLCEVKCADAVAVHNMAGMASGVPDGMGDMPPSPEQPSAVPPTNSTFAGHQACSHSNGVVLSVLRADRSTLSLLVITVERASAFRVDFQAVALEGFSSPSVSPPLHSPLLVPLRI